MFNMCCDCAVFTRGQFLQTMVAYGDFSLFSGGSEFHKPVTTPTTTEITNIILLAV